MPLKLMQMGSYWSLLEDSESLKNLGELFASVLDARKLNKASAFDDSELFYLFITVFKHQ